MTNIQEDYYRQEIFKSLVHLSQKIGALCLAEGVETEAESLTCLELGADLLQGFYFSQPQEPSTSFVDQSTGKIDPIADKFRKHMVDKINIRKIQHERYGLLVENLVMEFSETNAEEMDSKVSQELLNHPVAKAIYVLDETGLQATVMSCKTDHHQRQGIFRLPHKGTDYSLRDYYYALMEPGFQRKTFTSEPYISPATGLFCLTISAQFKSKDGKKLILCVDVVPTYLKNMGRLMTLLNG